jgi:hypothetical protein
LPSVQPLAKVNVTPSTGSFVLFETSMPPAEFAASLLKKADIGRSLSSYDLSPRISSGLPSDA